MTSLGGVSLSKRTAEVTRRFHRLSKVYPVPLGQRIS